MALNYDKIIHGTPGKRIALAYDAMKEDYSMESSKDFYSVYTKEPLSAVLENSRLIFSEPYYGLSYYMETVASPKFCMFSKAEEEYGKFKEFVESSVSKMPDGQRQKYEEALVTFEKYLVDTRNTRINSEYIKEFVDESFEDDITTYLYEGKYDEVSERLMDAPAMAVISYAPYISEYHNGEVDTFAFTENMKDNISLVESDITYFKDMVEGVVSANYVKEDAAYMEAVNSIPIHSNRLFMQKFMNESVETYLDKLGPRKVYINPVLVAESGESAVRNIFDGSFADAIMESDDNRDEFEAAIYEATLNLLYKEYRHCDDLSDACKGFSLIKEGTSVEDAFDQIFKKYSDFSNDAVFEASDDDEDFEELEKDVQAKSGKGDDSSEKKKADTPSSEYEISTTHKPAKGGIFRKKPKAPKANLTRRIQNKAMDIEKKQYRSMAKAKRRGQELKNAGKAVTNLPRNIINSIKRTIKGVEEADDERRKNYFTEPGYRKKIFRDSKLALLYGGVAKAKLSALPIVLLARHASKQKDRRIRTELMRELETEIKIADEKINDAAANGDQKAKYQMMRYRDQMKAELVRVKTNSKYI